MARTVETDKMHIEPELSGINIDPSVKREKVQKQFQKIYSPTYSQDHGAHGQENEQQIKVLHDEIQWLGQIAKEAGLTEFAKFLNEGKLTINGFPLSLSCKQPNNPPEDWGMVLRNRDTKEIAILLNPNYEKGGAGTIAYLYELYLRSSKIFNESTPDQLYRLSDADKEKLKRETVDGLNAFKEKLRTRPSDSKQERALEAIEASTRS